MDYVFANFDVVFNLEQIKVIEVSGDNAKVYYQQTTHATRGEGFPPTRATGIHHMKKENGKWKIFETEYLTNEQIM
jgi:ketosteroid isomerase-like protein